ncbi:MAG: hypothetical protein NTZ73_01410 [Candidatus Diapherotrites archaeon]|nr:hypothetical protein [Candidatus Diapherotrites archaeon]
MDFKIDNGPWETIFAGKFYDRDIEIVSNPEHLFLIFAYESDGKEKIGALVEGYKAFTTRGNMEAFIETLPKPSVGIMKSLGDRTVKLFFVSLDLVYLDFKHEDFIRKIDKLIANVSEMGSTIFDLARASSLELKELSLSPKNDYEPILGDPFTLRLLAGGAAKSVEGEEMRTKAVAAEGRKLQIGLTKEREMVLEDVENFSRTLIMANSKNEQNYSMYIVAENFLLENSPLLIFDSDDYFEKLKVPSKDEIGLKEALVEFDPIGFPVKKMKAKNELRVSLKDADFLLLLNLLGIGDQEFEKKFALAASSAMVDTPEELLGRIENSPPSDAKNFEKLKFGENGAYFVSGLTDFEKLKAERLTKIIEQEFNNLFGKSIDPNELIRDWPGNLGKATVVDTKNLSGKERTIFEQTILRALLKSLKGKNRADYKVFIPNAEGLFGAMPEKTAPIIISLENKGIGFVFGICSKTFPSDLIETTNAKISVIAKNDVAVSIKNQRNYRVLLRPSLSGDAKI